MLRDNRRIDINSVRYLQKKKERKKERFHFSLKNVMLIYYSEGGGTHSLLVFLFAGNYGSLRPMHLEGTRLGNSNLRLESCKPKSRSEVFYTER